MKWANVTKLQNVEICRVDYPFFDYFEGFLTFLVKLLYNFRSVIAISNKRFLGLVSVCHSSLISCCYLQL